VPLQVAKDAQITLEQGDQVVPVPAVYKSQSVFLRLPIETIFINRDVSLEVIKRMVDVTGSTPNLVTGCPKLTQMCKVGAE